MADWTRLELATPGVTGQYSNQLNYQSNLILPCFNICSPIILSQNNWWVMTGSNRRHPPCKGGALPAELITQLKNLLLRVKLNGGLDET